ncbi:DUF3179 domain-containing protein [bacterium]|nr:DUF3179 domain-containing protein [bacterium]
MGNKKKKREIMTAKGPIRVGDINKMFPYWEPLEEPVWVPADPAEHMRPDDPVLGLLVEGKAFALPWWVMKNHHQANLVLEGQPILVNLCEACSSAAAFNAVLDGSRITFRQIRGAFAASYLIMDYKTKSFWAPFLGEALHGPLEGSKLEQFPIYHATWADWKELYPGTVVPNGEGESRDGHGCGDKPGGAHLPGFAKMAKLDDRLPLTELVLGVKVNGHSRAYPLTKLHEIGPVLNDSLGGQEIVVLSKSQTWVAMAFSRNLDGECLEFRVGQDGSPQDSKTNSSWDFAGKSLSGPLANKELSFVTSGVEEWFAWAARFPDTEIFDGTSHG